MNRKIRCLIVDDEPLAREGLARYAGRIDWLETAGECGDAFELDARLRSGETIDLIFLDIEMPGLTGLEYLSALERPPMVIVTTAYARYALEGYELNVTDYLLKPVSFVRFMKAAGKARDLFLLRSGEGRRDYAFLRADRKLHQVRFADILYIEAVENYVKVVTADNVILTRTTLHTLVEELPRGMFLQVHKSFVVNMAKVSSIEGNMLSLPGATVTVSRSYKQALAEWTGRR